MFLYCFYARSIVAALVHFIGLLLCCLSSAFHCIFHILILSSRRYLWAIGSLCAHLEIEYIPSTFVFELCKCRRLAFEQNALNARRWDERCTYALDDCMLNITLPFDWICAAAIEINYSLVHTAQLLAIIYYRRGIENFLSDIRVDSRCIWKVKNEQRTAEGGAL